MYAHIAKHGTPLAIYKAHLLSSGGLDATEVEGVIAAEQSKIEAAFAASEEYAVPADNWMADNAGACGLCLLSFVFCLLLLLLSVWSARVCLVCVRTCFNQLIAHLLFSAFFAFSPFILFFFRVGRGRD